MVAMVEMRNQTVVWHQGHIGRGIRFPGEVRVILPIGIVRITVWGIRLWLVLTYDIGIDSCHGRVSGINNILFPMFLLLP